MRNLREEIADCSLRNSQGFSGFFYPKGEAPFTVRVPTGAPEGCPTVAEILAELP
jgi:hypothetical protein